MIDQDPGEGADGGARHDASRSPSATARSTGRAAVPAAPADDDPVRRRVAVLMGGRSSEHEVSLASAAAVIAALDPERDEVIPVLISPEGAWSVDGEPVAIVPGGDGGGGLASLAGGPERAVDVVFPVLHGPHGEDGTVQGALETAGRALRRRRGRRVGRRDGQGALQGLPRARRHPDARARRGHRRRVGARPRDGARPRRRGRRLPGLLQAGPPRLERRHQPRARRRRRSATRWSSPSATTPRPSSSGRSRAARSRSACSTATRRSPRPVGEITFEGDWYDYETKYVPGRSRPAGAGRPAPGDRRPGPRAGPAGVRRLRLRRPRAGRLLRGGRRARCCCPS